ncbi:octaprenyl-diphosphate synthase [Legionella gratiana]|uniref:Octaprenyl-diphosphate synthase n=1 Tax=Legionella gratiana TaxID=45066 RepID=A0A378JHW7_9GAMM|nr:polyprenyl synthetase family protein [Legionella gratiana]KTD11929.1 octaprenyl-diphosphate synthase [Legionella gratiana]STX46467.1 octaprenyl-diphosphate synthase [Legionella gratiana]
MGIDHLRDLVSEDFEAVNHLIIETIKSPIQLIDDIAHHVIQSGGKRLRCLLVLLASRTCGYEGKEHIMLAAMIEFFHTATLLHDDVIDDSTLRRGRETANKIWGNKASILVGDYLFTKYLELMVEVGDIDIIQLLIGIAPQMGCGEIQQFSNRHNSNLSVEEYFDMIRAKTALLFAASATMGALISKSNHEIQKAMYSYGLHLGNAFQLIDDALDYCSDAQTIGKNIGDDLATGKITLPLLQALKHGTAEQQLKIRESLEQGTLLHLPSILDAIAETKAIEYTRDIADKEADFAIDALSILPDSEYKSALEELARYVVHRKH